MEIKILKVGTCPTLSGNSTLTYQVGSKDQEIYLRIIENSASGLFSKKWVSLEQILLSLSSGPVTSRSLHELLKGKSINTAGFVLAVLRHEGLVQAAAGKNRGYTLGDPASFKSAMDELMESGVSLEVNDIPPTPPAKSAKKLKKVADDRGPR